MRKPTAAVELRDSKVSETGIFKIQDTSETTHQPPFYGGQRSRLSDLLLANPPGMSR